jgi:hypothetical protein
VRALPLAAGINVGGHYKRHFFLSLSSSLQLIANSPRRGCRRVLNLTTIFVDGRQKVVTTINFFLEKNEKNEKCLELPDLARKLIRKIF